MTQRDLPIYWRIPMTGDMSSWRNAPKTRGDWTPAAPGSFAPGARDRGHDNGYTYLDYMIEVARAAESAGFYGGLLPSFPQTDDPWIASAAMARATKTFRFMIAFQPGFLDPVQTARMSATLQRLSHGRVVYNIIAGGGGPPQRWWGDFTSHDDRYARTTEFLDVLKGVWSGGPFDYDGRFYHVAGAGLSRLAGQPLPDLFFSGSSDAAIDAAAAHADYYLSWLEHPDDLRRKFDRVRERTALHGRRARFARARTRRGAANGRRGVARSATRLGTRAPRANRDAAQSQSRVGPARSGSPPISPASRAVTKTSSSRRISGAVSRYSAISRRSASSAVTSKSLNA